MTDRQLMQQALEAQIHKAGMNPVMQGECYLMHPEALQKLIEVAIREALAEQPAQQIADSPDDWSDWRVIPPQSQPAPMIRGDIRDGLVDDEPAQRTWVGLEPGEISKIATSDQLAWANLNTVENRQYFARAIEAAHGIKEHT